MSGILHPRELPPVARPTAVPVGVRGLCVVDVREGDDGVLVLVECYLPNPVANAGCLVDNRSGIVAGIVGRLVHGECAFADFAELLPVDVAQDGTVTLVDIYHVEIQPVRLLVVGVARGVAEIDLVFAVAVIFRIGSGARRLHNLLRTEVETAVVVGIGHRQAGDCRVPVDASPTEVDMVGVVAEDERRRVGGVILCSQEFLFAQLRDVARLARDAIPDLRFVGVAGVENHDALVGKHQECGVVMVVGLEIAAYEHFLLARNTIVADFHLCRLHIAVNIDIAHVGYTFIK